MKENENKHPEQPQHVIETPVTMSTKVDSWIQENKDTFLQQLETPQGLDRENTDSRQVGGG